MESLGNWPSWVVVLACGLLAQVLKFALYSVTNRHLAVSLLGQSHGLPSFPTALLSCLLVMTVLRQGWTSAEAGFALIFAVIVVHDTVKLRVTARRQREVLYRLVDALPDAGTFHQRVAGYLDPRVHHPSHVVVGGLFGALFALAFGTQPS
jgi:acid phosphatase family membrane protein YuiD